MLRQLVSSIMMHSAALCMTSYCFITFFRMETLKTTSIIFHLKIINHSDYLKCLDDKGLHFFIPFVFVFSKCFYLSFCFCIRCCSSFVLRLLGLGTVLCSRYMMCSVCYCCCRCCCCCCRPTFLEACRTQRRSQNLSHFWHCMVALTSHILLPERRTVSLIPLKQ